MGPLTSYSTADIIRYVNCLNERICSVQAGAGVSADPGNALVVGSDGKLYVSLSGAVVVSTDGGNDISLGSDGGAFFEETPNVSADANNDILAGSDGGAFLTLPAIPVDTHFGNTNLALSANRAHTAGLFGFTISGTTPGGVTWSTGVNSATEQIRDSATLGSDSVIQVLTKDAFSLLASDGTNTANLSFEPELIDFNSTSAGDTAGIVIGPTLVQLNSTNGNYYLGNTAGGNLPPVSALTWNLGLDATGKMVLQTPATGVIINGGNTIGAVITVGTNDAFDLNLETSGVERVNITGGATSGGLFRITNTTTNTGSTVNDTLTIRTNSTGTPSNGFGGNILFQAESSTTNNRDMVRLSAIWTTVADATRSSNLIYSDVLSGSGPTERFRFSSTAMTIASAYTIGNSNQTLTLGDNSGTITVSTTGTVGINLTASSSTTGKIIVGTTAYTFTTLAKEAMQWTDTYTVASGTGTFTAIAIDNTFNLTGTASGVQRGIDINPTLTSLTAATYRGIDIQYSNAAAYGIYQSGGLTQNYFAGSVGVGVSAPQTQIHVQQSSSSTIPGIEIEQLSTGDVALQLSIVGDAYAIGIDNSDFDRFKISYAAAEGTAVLGTNDRLAISSNGFMAIGHGNPDTNLHLLTASTSTVPLVEIENTNTGDAGIQLSIVGDSYAIGIDNSDNDLFKISYAAAEGTAVLGTGDVFTLSGAGAASFFSTVKLFGYTVATLPAGTVGMTAYVTDALAPTYGATVVGGGAVTIPVFYNGAAWISH